MEALWADWALVCQPPTQLRHELLRPATPCLLKDYRLNVPSGFQSETKCLYETLGERDPSHICYDPWQQWDETGGCHSRSRYQTTGTHFACLKIPLHHIYISEPFSSFVFPCAIARKSLHWISFHVIHKDTKWRWNKCVYTRFMSYVLRILWRTLYKNIAVGLRRTFHVIFQMLHVLQSDLDYEQGHKCLDGIRSKLPTQMRGFGWSRQRHYTGLYLSPCGHLYMRI